MTNEILYNLLMPDKQESNCADTCDADRISVKFLPPRALPSILSILNVLVCLYILNSKLINS